MHGIRILKDGQPAQVVRWDKTWWSGVGGSGNIHGYPWMPEVSNKKNLGNPARTACTAPFPNGRITAGLICRSEAWGQESRFQAVEAGLSLTHTLRTLHFWWKFFQEPGAKESSGRGTYIFPMYYQNRSYPCTTSQVVAPSKGYIGTQHILGSQPQVVILLG